MNPEIVKAVIESDEDIEKNVQEMIKSVDLRNSIDLKLVLGIVNSKPVSDVFISYREDSIQSLVPHQPNLFYNYES